jgi:hypothetical protein
MDTQSPAIRELSVEECESTAGGAWGIVALAIGAIGVGVGLAFLTTDREKVLVPKLDLPPSEEPVGW